jgi:hypothetical protein
MSVIFGDLDAARAVTRRMLHDWIPDLERRAWWHMGSGMVGPGEPMTDAEHAWLTEVEESDED